MYHNEKSEIYFCLFTYIYGCTYVVCSYVSLVIDTIPISLNRILFFLIDFYLNYFIVHAIELFTALNPFCEYS